jgi:hypothetical protein
MPNDVDEWMKFYDNPMKPVVQAMRAAILAADPRITETIKWSAPTFVYKGNMASFFPRSKKHASLMFHKGADIPGDFPGLLGDGKEARTFKVSDLDDLSAKKAELQAIARAWCASRDG